MLFDGRHRIDAEKERADSRWLWSFFSAHTFAFYNNLKLGITFSVWVAFLVALFILFIYSFLVLALCLTHL